jgi:hypothetical protein
MRSKLEASRLIHLDRRLFQPDKVSGRHLDRIEAMNQSEPLKATLEPNHNTDENQPSPKVGAIQGLLDFSFVEVVMDKDQVVETGGSCCSCS